jgi:hypothetical protein
MMPLTSVQHLQEPEQQFTFFDQSGVGVRVTLPFFSIAQRTSFNGQLRATS